jgi:hypothetical protein
MYQNDCQKKEEVINGSKKEGNQCDEWKTQILDKAFQRKLKPSVGRSIDTENIHTA